MKNYTLKIFFTVIIVFSLCLPIFSEALDVESPEKSGLVPCGNEVPCEFGHFLELINRVVNFLLFVLFIPLAAIAVIYAGGLLLFSGGSTEARGKAKNILMNFLWGTFWAVGAWLIIHTILDILGYEGSWIGF